MIRVTIVFTLGVMLSGCNLTPKSDSQSQIVVKQCGQLHRDLSKPMVNEKAVYRCGKDSMLFIDSRSPLLGDDGKLYSVEEVIK